MGCEFLQTCYRVTSSKRVGAKKQTLLSVWCRPFRAACQEVQSLVALRAKIGFQCSLKQFCSLRTRHRMYALHNIRFRSLNP